MVGHDVASDSEQPEQILGWKGNVVDPAPSHQIDLGDQVVEVSTIGSQGTAYIAEYPRDTLVVQGSKACSAQVKYRSISTDLLPIQWVHVSLFPEKRPVFQISVQRGTRYGLPSIRTIVDHRKRIPCGRRIEQGDGQGNGLRCWRMQSLSPGAWLYRIPRIGD